MRYVDHGVSSRAGQYRYLRLDGSDLRFWHGNTLVAGLDVCPQETTNDVIVTMGRGHVVEGCSYISSGLLAWRGSGSRRGMGAGGRTKQRGPTFFVMFWFLATLFVGMHTLCCSSNVIEGENNNGFAAWPKENERPGFRRMNLRDWIKVYDDVIPADFCDRCLDMFDNPSSCISKVNERWRRCELLAVSSDPTVFNEMKRWMRVALNRYQKELQIRGAFTKLETANLIRYRVQDAQGPNLFQYHSDNWSVESATRQISVVLYLNDVREGGQTIFPQLHYSVQPKKARLLVFPSFYLFPHRGESPISEDKTILVTWLHFGGKGHKYRVSEF